MNIREIAKQAQLSIATISRVINHPETVAPETRERVSEILEQNFYTTKLMAKKLKKKNGTVVLIVPSLSRYFEIISGVRSIIQSVGYLLTTCETADFKNGENACINKVALLKPDGVIIACSTDKAPDLSPLKQAGIPTVMVGKCMDLTMENSCYINYQDAATKMTIHLSELKYTSIGLVQIKTNYPEKQQITNGFLQALSENSIDIANCKIFETDNSVQGGYILLKELILEGDMLPQALFAVDDKIAIGLIKAAQEEKIQLPRQLAVVGFTNSEMATVLSPTLTTVEHPVERLGNLVARRLVDLMEDSELYEMETHEIVLKSKLKIRKSCGNKKNIYEQFE